MSSRGVRGRRRDVGGKKVPPRFELGLEESEPSVITTYTMGP